MRHIIFTTAKKLRDRGVNVPGYIPDEADTMISTVDLRKDSIVFRLPFFWREDGNEVAAWVGSVEYADATPNESPANRRLRASIRREVTPEEAARMDEECADLMFCATPVVAAAHDVARKADKTVGVVGEAPSYWVNDECADLMFDKAPIPTLIPSTETAARLLDASDAELGINRSTTWLDLFRENKKH